ncbi:MAG TPA: ABC transporter permease [Terracidiphilus sp.]|nr:ABC transporter permease [Terracidiphilus sp.]
MLLQDIRYALRQLRKRPAFTSIVVLMLALGIGANTAVFSVMNAILLELLPVERPHGLSYVRMANGEWQPDGASNTGDSNTSFSEAVFEALRQRSDVFEDLIAYVPLSFSDSVAIRHSALPEEAEGEEVSGNFFSGLGVRLERGRGFTLADEKSHAPVALLSYDYWTRSYARDPGIVGKTMYVKGVPVTVIGVTARGFKGIEPASSTDFWVPLQSRPELNAWGATSPAGAAVNTLYSSTKWWSLRLMTRLRPGVSPTQAQQALTGTFADAARKSVGSDLKKWKPLLDFVPARGISGLNEQYRDPVRILMGLVALVLLIACTNVAMMIQARNSERQREFSLRLAIGAHRSKLFRQLLCESVLLVTAGAGLGWLFALAATRMLAVWSQIETGLSPDRNVLWFTLTASTLAALVFGLVPLWSAVHAPVAGVLRATAANVTSSRSRVIGARAVLAAQVAICLVLLMAAALLLRTLRNYSAQNLGIDTHGLLVFGITPQGNTDDHPFYRSLLERLRQVPGVESVSLVGNRPGSGWTDNNGLTIDGVTQQGVLLRSNDVGPGFFRTMGIPILAGRDVKESDKENTQRVIVVNETLARKYFPHSSPLGHHLGGGKNPSLIVGVVRDSKYNSVAEEPMPMAYYAVMQAPSLGTQQVEVRTRGDAASLLPLLRKTVAESNPNIPLEKPMTQQEQFDESYSQQRMFAAMGGFFGVLAALLVATGLYGSHSFRVDRRTTEIGVRMALGASRSQVLTMMMRESLWVMAGGLALGIPLTLLAVRPLKSMLYQMSPFDATSMALAVAIIAVVSLGAVLIPARRAASIEPMRALRAE